MGWRFRKSFTVIPGLKLNLSKSGLSASIGGAPFTLNVGPHGVIETASIPGTGLSYRRHLNTGSYPAPSDAPSPPSNLHSLPSSSFSPEASIAPIEEIHSASTELLTSKGLRDLKKLIQTTFEEHEDISLHLSTARDEKTNAESRYNSWEHGFLFKHIFKKTFACRKENLDTATEKVSELEEQLRLTTIATHIEIEKTQEDFYYRLRDDFAALCECAALWDIKSHQATDKFHERTTASLRLDRQRVTFALGNCDLIRWEQKVPHIKNSKDGDIYLYPGFILYRAAREAFSLIEYHDVESKTVTMSFQEEEGVPADSKVIGQTWAKANKDGSRDRRFTDNYQIPIVQYGQVTLRSNTGLWEEFQFSNPQRLVSFVSAFNTFTASFAAIAR